MFPWCARIKLSRLYREGRNGAGGGPISEVIDGRGRERVTTSLRRAQPAISRANREIAGWGGKIARPE